MKKASVVIASVLILLALSWKLRKSLHDIDEVLDDLGD